MYDKYDRQVRLIGREVQDKIQRLSVSLMDYSRTMVGPEIIKNFVLLGIKSLYINKKDSCKQLILNDIDKLNDNLELEITNELNLNCDIKIIIDGRQFVESEDIVYVCTRCMSFNTGCKVKDCRDEEVDIIEECLLGAIIVQELVKKVSGREYLREYKIKL